MEDTYMFNTLLVEDDVSYRQTLSDVLHLHFPLISVDEAGDGREALSKVEYRRPDLIFMDTQLPGENGLDVSKEIKRVYNEIVIVILTRNCLPEKRQFIFADFRWRQFRSWWQGVETEILRIAEWSRAVVPLVGCHTPEIITFR